jgi:hypothetical protein
MTTHLGYYNWGARRQSHAERIRRAEIDRQMARQSLVDAKPGTDAHRLIQRRCERVERQLAELEGERE